MERQWAEDPAAVYETPYGEPDQQLRWLLQRLGMTTAEAAQEIEMEEEQLDAWYAGELQPPKVVLLALRHLADRLRWID